MSSQVADRPRIGTLLRDWRVRRRMSQQDLALEAGVSARHVSFVETGRARPSADMVVQLAEHLDVPLRDRNTLLLAAGFAPAYAQRDLDEPEMGPVREAIDRVLRGHEPYPAVVVDRHWGLVAGQPRRPAAHRRRGGAPARTARQRPAPQPAPRGHGAADRQPRRVARAPARPPRPPGRRERRPGALRAHGELAGYPGGEGGHVPDLEAGEIAVPLRLRTDDGELAFISTATTFGTATDVTVSELAIESFFPADDATASALTSPRRR